MLRARTSVGVGLPLFQAIVSYHKALISLRYPQAALKYAKLGGDVGHLRREARLLHGRDGVAAADDRDRGFVRRARPRRRTCP